MQLSLQRSVAQYGHKVNTIKLLHEYTLHRIWALRSQLPPKEGEQGAPSDREMDELAKDLFDIRMDEMEKAFKGIRRERAAARAAARAAEEADEEDMEGEGEDSYDREFAEFREETEKELKKTTVNRWRLVRDVYDDELKQLTFQLHNIRDAAAGAANDFSNAQTLELYSSPPLRLPHIRDFLSQGRNGGTRGTKAKAWLRWLRELHTALKYDDEPDEQRMGGSVYSTDWPQTTGPTLTPPDHVVPQQWLRSCELLVEQPEPQQLPAIVLCTNAENSSKSDHPLWIFNAGVGTDPPSVWKPAGTYVALLNSSRRFGLLARGTCWIFGLFWGVSDHGAALLGVAPLSKSTGCNWYSMGFKKRDSKFKKMAKSKATKFERRTHLVTMAMQNWRFGNPLVFDEELLDADMEELLKRRFAGEDEMSKLVEYALGQSVAGAPRAGGAG
tara:strand:+ start:48 stop:1376 length:1329 start_codon:yes stop_codon:yes gene_type:complete